MSSSSATRPHRVLYLSLFGDLSRGGQNSTMLLLKGLDRSRVEPALVLPSHGNLEQQAGELGIPVYLVPWSRFRTLNLFQIWRSVVALYRVIRTFKPDIIHTDAPRNSHLAALLKGRAKLLVHLRVSTPDGLSDRLLAAEADAMIAVSQGVAQRFKSYPDRVQRKLHHVPNAVELSRFHSLEPAERERVRKSLGLPLGAPVVAFLASYDPVKRHDFFLELWPKVVEKVPEAVLALAGGGLEAAEAKWSGHLLTHKAEGSVRYLSFIDKPDEFLASCDLLVLPSSEEGFPRAAIEAAACGLPCVVSDLPGVREGIDPGITGVAVQANDPSAWVEMVVELITDNETRAKMGEQAVRYVSQHFSSDRHALRIMAIYDQLLN